MNKRDLDRFEIITADCTKITLTVKVNRIFLGLIPCCCFALEKCVQLLDKSRNAFIHLHHIFTDTAKVDSSKVLIGSKLINSNCCEQQRILNSEFSKPLVEYTYSVSDINLKELVDRFASRLLYCDPTINYIALIYASKGRIISDKF